MNMDMHTGVEHGGLRGTWADDVLIAHISRGSANTTNQIHIWAFAGDDRIVLDFSMMAGTEGVVTAGTHVRGDNDGITNRGADRFEFTNIGAVSDGRIVTGRLEDFDPSRDTLVVEGQVIDLTRPARLPDSVRVVSYNGAHNDPGALPQQYLVIQTGTGGTIFYALDGARVDMTSDGNTNRGQQEQHLVANGVVEDLEAAPTVDFVDPVNYVPAGYAPGVDGLVINDYDASADDVTRVISGSDFGDLIAAGLNDDRVEAGSGADIVWGGSGHDSIFGGAGADELHGGPGKDRIDGGAHADIIHGDGDADSLAGAGGNDALFGGDGSDSLSGGAGSDKLSGGAGRDVLQGNAGDDLMYGGGGTDTLFGQQGDDRLDGNAGNDFLYGGAGSDRLRGQQSDDLIEGGAGRDWATGGEGADTFVFRTGDLVHYETETSGFWTRPFQLDQITDFEVGVDRIVFDDFDGVDGRDDLWATQYNLCGEVFFMVGTATGHRLLVDVQNAASLDDLFVGEAFDLNFEIL